MRKYRRIKRSFTAGEVSPYLEGRTGADTFINGCKTLKNMVVLPEGPVVRRPGFKLKFDITISYGSWSNFLGFFRATNNRYFLLVNPYDKFGVGSFVIIDQYGSVMMEDPIADKIVSLNQIAILGDEIWLAQPNMSPKLYAYDGSSWTVSSPSLTGAPFSSTYGYPQYVFFHQQRLGFANTVTRPQGVWLSKVNDFFNFDITNTNADDPVSFQLDSDINSKIQWVHSGLSLLLGTDDDEWTVRGGGSSQLITPTSVLAQRHTNIGGQEVKPIPAGHTILFLERLGRAVYELLYDYYSDSYTTNDLIILSKHLTAQYNIIDWAYQQVPHKIIWALREDGVLLTLTYQREHKVIGWAEHTIAGFDIVALATGDINSPSVKEHRLWALVTREGFPSEAYIFELTDWQFEDPMYTGSILEPIKYCFLDASKFFPGSIQILTGLDYLEGKEVHILTNRGVHPTRVVENGSITLDMTYQMVWVGLPYESEVRPISVDIDTREGTTIGATQQVVEIDIILHKTRGLYIQRFNEDKEVAQEEELFFASPYITDFPNLFSGHYTYSFPEGYNIKTDYSLIQKDPLPFTLIGLVETVKVL